MLRKMTAALAVAATLLTVPTATSAPPRTSRVAVTAQVNPLTRLCTEYLNRTITVEALGDSVVAGGGATTPDRAWTARLARVLDPGQVWVGAQGGSTIVDYLPGGQYYWATQATRASQPTLVLWDWRINDQYTAEFGDSRGSTPAQLRDRYVQLASHIREASPSTTVLIVNPPKVIAPGWDSAHEWEYVQAMWEAKTWIPNALWLDLALYSPSSQAENDVGLMHPDGIHQADAGHAMTAAAVHQRIHGVCAR